MKRLPLWTASFAVLIAASLLGAPSAQAEGICAGAGVGGTGSGGGSICVPVP